MKGKKIKDLAKIMFKKSLKDGIVNPANVSLVLKENVSQKPQGLKNILKIYKHLVETKLAKEELIVETAQKTTEITKMEKELLSKTGAKRIKYKTNPKMVFGLKITHGDFVYDLTLGSKLKQLTAEK